MEETTCVNLSDVLLVISRRISELKERIKSLEEENISLEGSRVASGTKTQKEKYRRYIVRNNRIVVVLEDRIALSQEILMNTDEHEYQLEN